MAPRHAQLALGFCLWCDFELGFGAYYTNDRCTHADYEVSTSVQVLAGNWGNYHVLVNPRRVTSRHVSAGKF
ncbi:hypothetical protein PF005_g17644 [Phytophthora fragariae]|uniref:Secreted protein n=1 Tax=Phytophthora fragariae TaxID=53985 RepID=A0A6A3SR78_9STRA|nr:hypothetical protein PF003_g32218 [Phytophthora fragariae]KAE8938982.1 hypothetical protein PF009_g11152 [Phytophthora fragariae]KAE8994942.1 hypothetical protein PF011_g16538 [Phytophthora fragariae]KAE9118706.1 hypothetical protein PF007_g8833 [Phytophthora fragariae]KAE9133982.1 hypothetical protein PF006_g14925 [Phytophthora fragariae]